MRILGVNGIFTRGGGSTDLLLAELARLGHEVVDVDLPVRGQMETRWDDINYADAFRVLLRHRPGDAVVAHSRGCLVTHYALQAGARFSTVFLFAPAMEADWVWPAGPREIHVIHNPDDPALAVGSALLFHPFGDLGRTGYAGPADARVKCFEQRYPGHSDYFSLPEIARWARYVDGALRSPTEVG